MKKLIATLIVCCAVFSLSAAELEWLTDLPKAQAQAKAEKKLVFMNFTGSDWCGWCKKLDKDVFTTPEFIEYAQKNLVMVFVDFPSKKPISKEQKEANAALKDKYEVRGFPTLVVLNAAGQEVYKKVGYMGDPAKWIAELNAAKNK